MKKIVSLFSLIFLFTTVIQAQSIDKFFKKHSSDDTFEYISVGKGMMRFASIFTDYSVLTDGTLETVTSLKVLKLKKESATEALSAKFSKDVESLIEKGDFETTLEKRDKSSRTYVYKRVDKRANADVIVYTKDITGVSVVWLKGKTSDEEADRYEYEKEQRLKEEMEEI